MGSPEKTKFAPRTIAEVETMFMSARVAWKANVRQFMEAAMGSKDVDELGKATVMRWYRGRIFG